MYNFSCERRYHNLLIISFFVSLALTYALHTLIFFWGFYCKSVNQFIVKLLQVMTMKEDWWGCLMSPRVMMLYLALWYKYFTSFGRLSNKICFWFLIPYFLILLLRQIKLLQKAFPCHRSGFMLNQVSLKR